MNGLRLAWTRIGVYLCGSRSTGLRDSCTLTAGGNYLAQTRAEASPLNALRRAVSIGWHDHPSAGGLPVVPASPARRGSSRRPAESEVPGPGKPASRTRLLLDAAPNRGVERKKKLALNLGPMWEGPRPSGITPARGAAHSMQGVSGSSQTRLGARLGARNP